MFHSQIQILTSSGWMFAPDLYEATLQGGVDIATIVNNSLIFTKISKAVKSKESQGAVHFNSNEDSILPDLSLTEDHQICYSTSEEGEILVSSAKDAREKGNIFIPKSVLIPDGIEVNPDLQEYISTMGLMAILYLYASRMEKDHVILDGPSKNYVDDLATHAGFLKLKAEEFESSQIILDINPSIFGLSPLTNVYHNPIEDMDAASIKTCRVIPQWFLNAHPCAQKEFLRILLMQLKKFNKDEVWPWSHLPKNHIDKIMTMGIQCGTPIRGSRWENIIYNDSKPLVAKQYEKPFMSEGFYEFIVEPTNIVCVKSGDQPFICSGGGSNE